MKKFPYLKDKRNGFTLLELISVLAISSIIILTAMNVFNNTIKLSKQVESNEKLYLEGSFALDYMEREILASEEIIPLETTQYGEGIGFAIKKNIDEKNTEYRYISYISYNKILRRITTGNIKNFNNTDRSTILGDNLLAHNIYNMYYYLDEKNEILKINLVFKDENKELSFNKILDIEGKINGFDNK